MNPKNCLGEDDDVVVKQLEADLVTSSAYELHMLVVLYAGGALSSLHRDLLSKYVPLVSFVSKSDGMSSIHVM